MLDLSLYHEVFRDDFTGTSLDRSKWQILFGGPSTNGAFVWSHDDVSVGNGELTLSMTNHPSGWTAGGISTGGAGSEFGLYQVRARMDPGQGVDGGALLWPASNIWPGPEVDLMESPNADRSHDYLTVHWLGNNGQDSYNTYGFSLDVSQWHTYALDWTPDLLTYYIDGQPVLTTSDHVPQAPEWLSLQGYVANAGDLVYAGGPSAATPPVVSLHVDWVSISQLNTPPAPIPEPGTLLLLCTAVLATGLAARFGTSARATG